VIEDKNIQAAAAPENVETMADPGKAEPGRDIFAGESVKDIRSSNLPPEPVREQKEISSVNVGISMSSSASSASSTTSTTRSDSSEESAGSAASTVVSETASDATIESSAAAAAKVQAAGPLGEAELEAQKVANELYPDAKN